MWDCVLVSSEELGCLLTNTGFAVVEFHSTRTDANSTERRLHAVVTASELIGTQILVCATHNKIQPIDKLTSN